MRGGPRAASASRSDQDPRVGGHRVRATVTRVRVCRLRDSRDFERVLARPAQAVNRHFALHGLECPLDTPAESPSKARGRNLSTGAEPARSISVDNETPTGLNKTFQRCVCLGVVVPKRFARRSVTRSLLKRQIRCGIERHADNLPQGMWVVRLRATFDKANHVSATSNSLRSIVRLEVEQLVSAMTTAILVRGLETPQR